MVGRWHEAIFKNSHHIESRGCYRTHAEPMQIVSHRYGSNKLFFEAPSSVNVPKEMDSFIRWFNSENQPPSILGKAAIAHVYFESIHPFEDGNGRIGRALVEKSLSLVGSESPSWLPLQGFWKKTKNPFPSTLNSNQQNNKPKENKEVINLNDLEANAGEGIRNINISNSTLSFIGLLVIIGLGITSFLLIKNKHRKSERS